MLLEQNQLVRGGWAVAAPREYWLRSVLFAVCEFCVILTATQAMFGVSPNVPRIILVGAAICGLLLGTVRYWRSRRT